MKILLFITHAIFATALLAQSDVDFKASTNVDKIVEGGIAEVTFSLQNAQGTNFVAPTFKGLRVVRGPSTSYQQSIINGVSSTSMSFIYMVQTLSEGEIMIEPATIRIGNKVLKTKSIILEVVKGMPTTDATKDDSSNRFFVRMELSDTMVYPGQQLTLSYDLYSQIEIERFDILSEPEVTDFYLSPIRSFDRSEKMTVIDGVQYAKRTLRQIIFYPQKTGNYHFSPATIRLGVPDGRSRRRSFFFSVTVKPVTIQTNSQRLQVISLPDAPPMFSGAIGKYQSQFSLEENTIEGDEALNLLIQISGDGDANRISAPHLQSAETEFELFEPKMIRKDIKLVDWKPIEYKIYEYLAVPRKKGVFNVSPVFIYFDPDSSSYITLSDTFSIEVTSEPSTLSALQPDQEKKKAVISEIRPDLTLKRPGRNPSNSITVLRLFGLPFLGFLGVVFVKVRSNRLQSMDPKKRLKRNLRKYSLGKLDEIKQKADSENVKILNDGLQKLLTEFLSIKFDLDPIDITAAKSRELLKQHISSADQLQVIEDVLKDCELSVYANASEVDRFSQIEKVRSIISSL